MVPKDTDAAQKLYERASKLGNASAAFNLGLVKYKADPNQNAQQVVEIMKEAAYHGNDKAKDFLSKFSSQMQTQALKTDVSAQSKGVIDQNSINVRYESKMM